MYEIHVTIDPVYGEKLEHFKYLAEIFRFKVANLIKQNGQPNDRDQFATSHTDTLAKATERTRHFVDSLRNADFNVRRYKVEQIILDSKYGWIF